MLMRPEISVGLMGLLARKKRIYFLDCFVACSLPQPSLFLKLPNDVK